MTRREARQLLGVSIDAAPDEVRRSYHRLAREVHPDLGGDQAAFLTLQRAYETLLDEEAPNGLSPSWRGTVTERTVEAQQRVAEHATATRPAAPDVDVTTIDWDSPSPGKLDVARLARAIVDGDGTATAISRGPKQRLAGAARWLDSSLTARLRCGVSLDDGGHGIRLEVQRASHRRLVQQATKPLGWVRWRATSDVDHLSRAVQPAKDERHQALRLAIVATDMLDALGWPLGAWVLDDPT